MPDYELKCKSFRMSFDQHSHPKECCFFPLWKLASVDTPQTHPWWPIPLPGPPLGPLGELAIPMYCDYPSNVANWESPKQSGVAKMVSPKDWLEPEDVTVATNGPVSYLTFHYGTTGQKTSELKVTAHEAYLEFELTDVTGDCGRMITFGAHFSKVRGPRNGFGFNDFASDHSLANGAEPLLDLGYGLFAGLVPGNHETAVYRDCNRYCCHPADPEGIELISALSHAWLPTPYTYKRKDKFAFFICQEQDLGQTISEIEKHFDLPGGMAMKARPENNLDYWFVVPDGGCQTCENIIPADLVDRCQTLGMESVLLDEHLWHKHDPQPLPQNRFHLHDGTELLVQKLKKAGVLVGLHVFGHRVDPNDIFAQLDQDQQIGSAKTDTGQLPFKLGNSGLLTLPDQVAEAFAATVKQLGADWLYFDASGGCYETNGKLDCQYDFYLVPRITGGVLKALAAQGQMPVTVQAAGCPGAMYHYVSRMGQHDYFDDEYHDPVDTEYQGHYGGKLYRANENKGRIYANYTGPEVEADPLVITPHESFLHTIKALPYIRRAFYYPDLGWFGSHIHCMKSDGTGHTDRPPTWPEWQEFCQISQDHNIPMGILMGPNELNLELSNRPGLDKLIKAAIQKRKSKF